tara:strand:+ start:113 stop:805 length:693 start_codon:yes stop_codon:yes gene_type:complete
MSKVVPVLTIDGPSGTGKGTLCQLLASELGWNLLDSGALYRVLAIAAKHHAVSLDNEAVLEVLAAHLDVQFLSSQVFKSSVIILEGENVTDLIRSQTCGDNASIIAQLPKVRAALLERQRGFAEMPGLVTDGRDMGTVVFSDAFMKIYLDASIEMRAKRRHLQLKDKGINVSLAQVLEELQYRDLRDKTRKTAPLQAAKDAITIDTTNMNVEQVFEVVLSKVQAHFLASV